MKILTSALFFPAFLAVFISAPADGQIEWKQETSAAAWQARDSQGYVVFRDKLWLMGGWFTSQDAPPRDVWSSENGIQWEQQTAKAPWKHSDFPMTAVFKNKMWLMGGWFNGRLPGHEATACVWSSTDGKSWEQETPAAAWSPRLAGALVEFKGKLWLLGGIENYYFGDEKSLKNDVWTSENGKTWKLVTASAGWSPRAYHQALVFQNKLYVFGGGNYTPAYKALNDVWVTDDGKNWKQLTSAAPWHERIWFSTAVYRNRMWILGGWSGNPYKNWDDAWYSADGIHWTELKTGPRWKERHAQATYVFRDRLWVAGGMTPPLVNDVWSLYLPPDWSPAP